MAWNLTLLAYLLVLSLSRTHVTYQVDAFWDPDSAVWVASSDNIPGLATEADSIEALSQKLRSLIPELLRLNHVIPASYVGAIAFQLTSL